MSYISDELKARNIPDVLTFKDGTKLTDKADWEKRRTEMVEIIAENMFGHVPPSYPIETEEIKFSDKFLGKKIYYSKLMLKINTPKGQAQFPIYQFLPKDKTNITGYIYEPWHLRYVGVEAAKEITALGLTLEEYVLLVREERVQILKGDKELDESDS